MAHVALAAAQRDAGRHHEALQLLQDVVPRLEARLGEEHPEVIQAKMSLAVLHADMGELDIAIAVQREVLSAAQETFDADSRTRLMAVANLASMLLQTGDVEGGRSLQADVLAQLAEGLGWSHLETLDAASKLAVTLFNLGRYEDSLDLEQRVWAGRAEVLGEKHPDTLSAVASLGITLSALGRWEDARLVLSAALDGHQKLAEEDPQFVPALAFMCARLGYVMGQMGSAAEGLELVDHGIALLAGLSKERPDHFLADLAAMTRMRSVMLASTDQLLQSLESLREAIKIERTLANAYPAQHQERLASWLTEVAETLERLGRSDEAEAARREASALVDGASP